MWTGSWRIANGRDHVTITRSIMVIPRTLTLETSAVETLATQSGMQSGQTINLDIHARTHDGKKHKAGSSSSTKQEAIWLIERMNRAPATATGKNMAQFVALAADDSSVYWSVLTPRAGVMIETRTGSGQSNVSDSQSMNPRTEIGKGDWRQVRIQADDRETRMWIDGSFWLALTLPQTSQDLRARHVALYANPGPASFRNLTYRDLW